MADGRDIVALAAVGDMIARSCLVVCIGTVTQMHRTNEALHGEGRH